MRVYIETVLPCPPGKVWNAARRSDLLLEVAGPLVKLVPVDAPQFPECWDEGVAFRCKSYLFGIIPLGTRTVFMERIDWTAWEIQTRETDPLVRRWDHLIRVRYLGDGLTRYSDEIVIKAGLLTLFVWLFAQWFYRHRQRKWRQLAQRLVAA